MKDFKCILTEIKSGNKNAFIELVEQFSPLITKYSHLLYKDEFEDMKSELTVALWQAVCNIKKYDINKSLNTYQMHYVFVSLSYTEIAVHTMTTH